MNFPIYLPLIVIPARYFIIAGVFYLIFYILFKNNFIQLKIQNNFPNSKMLITEIFFSMQTMVIFGVFSILIRYLIVNDYSIVYRSISDFGMF